MELKNRFIRNWLLILIAFLVSVRAFGQFDQNKLDSLLNYLNGKELYAGQILLAEKGKVIFNHSYGTAPGWYGSEIINSTPLDIASVSKTFTAAAIMILQERGLLEYEDKLIKYYPQLPYPDVTVRQMLNHTSGLPNILGLIFEKLDHTKYYTNDDVIELLIKYKPAPSFQAGERFQYNNLGYQLLAGIIEQVSGGSYEQFLRTNFFTPLGMNNTFHYSENKEIQDNYKEITIDNFHLMTKGESNIYSTASDLYKWAQGIKNGKVLKKESIEAIYERPVLENGELGKWGLGWNILNPDPEDFTIQHMGEGIHTTTSLTRFITKDATYIFIITGSRVYAYDVFKMVENFWQDKPYEVPEKRIVHDIDSELLQQYAGDYGENGFMHLFIENDEFFMHPDGAPSPMKLIPESDSTFYFEDQHMQWQIYKSDGEIIGFGPKGNVEQMMKRKN